VQTLAYSIAMEKRVKKRMMINLTPDLYRRCHELSKEHGVNWSLVAEAAFSSVVTQFDRLNQVVVSATESGQSVELIKAAVIDEVKRSVAQIEQEVADFEGDRK
jgi:hypothetical protein